MQAITTQFATLMIGKLKQRTKRKKLRGQREREKVWKKFSN